MGKWHKASSSQKRSVMAAYAATLHEQLQAGPFLVVKRIFLTGQKTVKRCTRSDQRPFKARYGFGQVVKGKRIILVRKSIFEIRAVSTFIQAFHGFLGCQVHLHMGLDGTFGLFFQSRGPAIPKLCFKKSRI